MTAKAERSQFSVELRRWRELRRWSQLELAIRSGTTQRHLSFMEQGRSRPGRAMVARLAETMELSLRERNRLLHAAGYVPVFAESPVDDIAIRAARDALTRILEGHLPYPAVIVRPYGELVAANAAIDLLISDVDPAMLVPPINVLRLALHPDGVARRVLNLAEWGRHIIENLRARALRSPDPEADRLIAELEGYVSKVVPDADHLGFAVPLRLRVGDDEIRLLTTLTSFATATDITLAELTLEAFLPADDHSAEVLRAAHRQRNGRPSVLSGLGSW